MLTHPKAEGEVIKLVIAPEARVTVSEVGGEGLFEDAWWGVEGSHHVGQVQIISDLDTISSL